MFDKVVNTLLESYSKFSLAWSESQLKKQKQKKNSIFTADFE